jgi:hypothetical protein
VIQNNIFHGFEVNPIELNGANKNAVSIENNLFYGNGFNGVNLAGPSPFQYTNQNNLVSDPLFEAPGTNFSLTLNSPAINAGLNTGRSEDFVGHAVPDGTAVDIGAFEFVGMPPVQVPLWWLESHGLTNQYNSAVLSDSDDDRLLAWEEYMCGTDPTNSASFLGMTGLSFSNTVVQLAWVGGSSVVQHIECKTSLTDPAEEWVAIYTNTPPMGVSNVLQQASTNDSLFFRVTVP